MEAINVKDGLWEEVMLPKINKMLIIEVACSEVLDFGILDRKNLDSFYKSSSDKNLNPVQWFEEEQGLQRFEIILPDISNSYYLVLWNAYSKKKIFVCYNWLIKSDIEVYSK